MLDDIALTLLYQAHDVSEAGRQLIQRIRSSDPSRRVRSGFSKVSSRYASVKMGCTLQAANNLDLAVLYLLEHDNSVYEIWDQPPQIRLEYLTAAGKNTANLFIPQFFILTTDFSGWIEVQSEEYLKKHGQQSPHRYTQREDGTWECPPGMRYAEQFGLSYRVWSSAEVNEIRLRNTVYLGDFYHPDCQPITETAAEIILNRVINDPGILLSDLLTTLEGATSADIYKLIVSERIYVDLETDLLPEPDRVRCYRDIHIAQAYKIRTADEEHSLYPKPHLTQLIPGALLNWDGRPWYILNVGEKTTTLNARDDKDSITILSNIVVEELVRRGEIRGLGDPEPQRESAASKRLKQVSPKQYIEANRRHRILQYDPKQQTLTPEQQEEYESKSERSRYRWKKSKRLAEQAHGDGYVGLFPNTDRQGNHNTKIPDETLEELEVFLKESFFIPTQPTFTSAHEQFKLRCAQKGLLSIGYTTFAKEIRKRQTYQNKKAREGHRAAYDSKPTAGFFWHLGPNVPPHGDHPWHIGHIDHTQLDLEVICSKTGKNLGRPWVTFLTSANTRRIVAIYMTFDPPSYRSDMMVIRICVKRYGRLFDIIVADGGGDFHSVYFETLLARYNVTLRTRPPAEPRSGNVLERLFGTSNTQFLHNLSGNTKVTKQDVRKVTQSVDPKNLALWPLGRLYFRLCQWGYEVYDQSEHITLGQSPQDAHVRGIAQSGVRETRFISYDQDFIIDTLPTTAKGTAKVQLNQGVKINSIYYMHPSMLDPELVGSSIPVRYDPFNAGIAYVFIQKAGGWIECRSEHYAVFRGMTERQLQIATEELRQRRNLHGKQINARMLALFIQEVFQEEKTLKVTKATLLSDERRRTSENNDVNTVILGQFMPQNPADATRDPPGNAPPRGISGRTNDSNLDTDENDSDEQEQDDDEEDRYGTY